MLAVEMGFPAGRYHATPWDRQVNEGVVEWPPSPWRILRALISTWYHKAQGEVDEATLRDIIEKLTPLPSYYLPPAAQGHTRHYMPLFRSPIDGKTTEVFDAFATFEDGERMIIYWTEVDLSESESDSLALLLSRLGYLGRAESWVEARLVEDPQIAPNAFPVENGTDMPDGFEGVRTLACMPSEAYLDWRRATLEAHNGRRLSELKTKAMEKGKPIEKVKLSKRDLKNIEENLPADLFQALHADTGNLKKGSWVSVVEESLEKRTQKAHFCDIAYSVAYWWFSMIHGHDPRRLVGASRRGAPGSLTPGPETPLTSHPEPVLADLGASSPPSPGLPLPARPRPG